MLFRLQEEGGVLREMFRNLPGERFIVVAPTSRKKLEVKHPGSIS